MSQIVDTFTVNSGAWRNLLTILTGAGYSSVPSGILDIRNRHASNEIIIKSSIALPDYSNSGGIHLVNGAAYSGRFVLSQIWIKAAVTVDIDIAVFSH